MRERLRTVLALSAAAVLAVCCCAAMVRGVGRGRAVALEGVSFTDLSALRRWSGREGAGRTTSLASTAGDPIPAGHVIHVDVPGSALQSLRVGATIQGKVNKQMLRQDGTEAINAVDFVGKVRSLQMITVQGKVQSNVLGQPDEGVVSVKLMSDHYVAPGTAVTGMVAGKIFKGVVTSAPSIQDRMDEDEAEDALGLDGEYVDAVLARPLCLHVHQVPRVMRAPVESHLTPNNRDEALLLPPAGEQARLLQPAVVLGR